MAVDSEIRRRPRYSAGFLRDGPGLAGAVHHELERIAEYLALLMADGVQFEVWSELPPRPREGLVMFFAAGVAGAGAGLYQYAGGIWKAL